MKSFILLLALAGFAIQASAQERKLKDTALESKPVQIPEIRAPKLKRADSFLKWSRERSQPMPASLFEADFKPAALDIETIKNSTIPSPKSTPSEQEWMKHAIENSVTLPAVDSQPNPSR